MDEDQDFGEGRPDNELVIVDIGCGPYKLKGAIGLDIDPTARPDAVCDITKGIPLKDDSVDHLFASHVLEHVPPATVDFLLSEVWRVCQPDGAFVIVVPHVWHESAQIPWHHCMWSPFAFGERDSGHGLFRSWFDVISVELEYDPDGLALARKYLPEAPDEDLARMICGVVRQTRVTCRPRGKGTVTVKDGKRDEHWSAYIDRGDVGPSAPASDGDASEAV